MSRIMLVDDDAGFTKVVSMVLTKEGYDVVVVDDTEGLTDRIREERPDAIVLDVMFPENSSAGFELARSIRRTEDLSRVPVVLLTAINTRFPMGFGSSDIDEAWMPVDEFVEKPVDFDVLLGILGRLVKPKSGSDTGRQPARGKEASGQ